MKINNCVVEDSLYLACEYLELSSVVQTEDIFTPGKLLVKDVRHKVRHEFNLDQGSGLMYSPCLVRCNFYFYFFLPFSDVFFVTYPH